MAMTEEQALAELTREDAFDLMTDDERRRFENILILRAYVRGWTGDALCQPGTSRAGGPIAICVGKPRKSLA